MSRSEPAESEAPLETPLQFLKGAGPRRAELLRKLELETVEDLLWYLPRDYLDLSDIRPIPDLEPDKVQSVRGRVVDYDLRRLTRQRTLVGVMISAGGDFLRGMWFNQPWMVKKFRPDDLVLFSGKPKKNAGRWEMSNPRVQWLTDEDDADSGGVILPRYGLTEGLKMHEIRAIARNAVERYSGDVVDPLPLPIRKRNKLPVMSQAFRFVHLPETLKEIDLGEHCLRFHDLLDLQIALAWRRMSYVKRENAPRFPLTPKIDARIRRLFPFSLTEGQEKAVHEIAADLDSGRYMHRLLQADVGAGKTAIAIYAMLTVIAAGYQVALMAPTEILTRQHWETIERMLAHSRVKRLLLTGNLSAAQRKRAREELRSGEVQLIVGTQSLIQQDVSFQKLGLVVIDEQHRFGVLQRAHFTSGDSPPHVLVMTATPIPRSLCLTAFGDLDLSVIRELPPGRQKVVTSLVRTADNRREMWSFIREKLRSGRQLYVVCPRIEGEEEGEGLKSAEEVFRSLSQSELKTWQVGLIHGRQDRDERRKVMQQFRDRKIDVIVSTTVIEVGVDVPNATLMVIYDPEHFGLSQIHQLRGRIGRGEFQGYCFLDSETEREEALERLEMLEKLSDGFQIAEADFQLRGPGDILGVRQHGELPLRVAELPRDQEILEQARSEAWDLVESGTIDAPDCQELKQRVLHRFQAWIDVVGTG